MNVRISFPFSVAPISLKQLAGHALNWFRLDDGVMGGQSETNMNVLNDGETNGLLHFEGIINTNGGGFTSIRSKVPDGLFDANNDIIGVKIQIQGDGKTYKFFTSDGSRGGPMSRKPSWQFDIPTKSTGQQEVKQSDGGEDATNNIIDNDDDDWEEIIIRFDELIPSFGGSARQSVDELKKLYEFNVTDMKEIGFMLSLKLSNGDPNPVETFGEGIFPFTFKIRSIELLQETKTTVSTSDEK